MSKSQFILIILILLMVLLLPYGIKSGELNKTKSTVKSEQIYTILEG
ncbi:MAG: hypothetical protein OEV55_06035 [candidate division Zixibacteria bacterium]|nr:hypothetical protein [candidate division Zixibacteria bacterium]